MGFDISGVNPTMHKTDYPLLEKYDHDNFESWGERQEAMEANGEERKYWEQYNQQQEDNPGIYFVIMYGGGDLYGILYVSIAMIYYQKKIWNEDVLMIITK